MDLILSKTSPAVESTLVVLVDADGGLSAPARQLDDKAGGIVRRALKAQGPDGPKSGSVLHLLAPGGLELDHLLLAVLGKKEAGAPKRLEIEELGAVIAQKLGALKVAEASLALPEASFAATAAPALLEALAAGAALRSYHFGKYQRPEKKDQRPRLEKLTFVLPSDAGWEPSAAEAALTAARHVADGVVRTKDLVSEPSNVKYPETVALACLELKAFGVEVDVLDEKKQAELKMGALLAVSQGSARPSRVVVMRWNGAGADEAPLAFIGKGVTFDTGGISIKPAAGMEEMKWDMAGAGTVIGLMQLLASRKAKVNVVGVIGLAENMPSGTATRPGDVVTAMSGTTIEVINTDAEGRLVLSDVLWYTNETFKPRFMVDLATLTGAVVVALGKERAGLFANDDKLAAQLLAAGDATGEKLWRLPLGSDYDKHIKSDIADIKNVGRSREAGSTAGAVFLQRFVGETPWAHLDIAGTAWSNRDLPLSPKGATAFGVRLLDRLVAENFE
ncbi:leucyl aminopeptidase [Arboricoccus pini]|uniref:Probable cytosol aminopeptidase n=1 Tax=Arboricoccus pini TaxID=1963835 RepID=A0A212Q7T4_9PROT|nr:leucyl aminopeptidase [Arboricoccus pini]SNB55435.1 leucyl aminopeptidase [Arboricoccus pini]